jgi:opacity protein-like surface antigen
MKRIVSAFLALAVSATLVFVVTGWKHGVTAVHAQGGCSVATLSGNYGFTSSGFATPNRSVKGTEIPFAVVGGGNFDGAGNFSVTYTLATRGGISQGLTASGNYTVNSDCTGTATFTAGAAAGITENMVIVSGGAEVFQIITTPSFTVTFDVKKE